MQGTNLLTGGSLDSVFWIQGPKELALQPATLQLPNCTTTSCVTIVFIMIMAVNYGAKPKVEDSFTWWLVTAEKVKAGQ